MIRFHIDTDKPVEMKVGSASLIMGEDGKSAYELAVENGFDGTVQEWLASLKGEPGEPGKTGETGPAGPAGAAGHSPEITIVNGVWFIDGKSTGIGAVGPEGPKGEPGRDGADGATGPAGSDASVTSANIETALGFKPADAEAVRQLSEEKANKLDVTAYGLPILHLTGDVSAMTKENAVNLDYQYGERSGTASVKWQGSSSLEYDKKNYTIKFDNAFEAVEGWGEQKKYCLKANYIDCSHSRNVVSAKIWGQIVKARTNVPAELVELPNCGAVDGFPCVIMLNGEFHGLYTFNIPKDGWMFGMGNGNRECIMCANNHSPATRFETTAVCDESDFEIEYITDENDTQWAIDSLNALISAVLASDGSDIDSVIAKHVDIDSAIDFYLFTVLQSGTDNEDKNYILATFDGVKWFFSTYDMDGTFGLVWNGNHYWNPETAWPSFVGFQNKLFQLLRMHKPGAIKRRYMELRKGVLSDGAVITMFANFMSTIPSAIRDKDFEKWPLIPSTLTNDLSQISTNYLLRTKSVDPVINGIVVPFTNLVPTSIDPQTGEIFGGVGYQDNYVATTPEYGYQMYGDNTGYVSTGLIEFPVYNVTAEGQVYESPVMYVKGDIEFSTSDDYCRIVSYVSDRTTANMASKAGSVYFNAEKLGEGYYKITYLPNSAGIKAKIVDWTGVVPQYIQLSMRGTGSGLIVSVGEPIK